MNGASATAADLEAAYTPGDTITFQAADPATNPTADVTLTNAPLQGQIDNFNDALDTYQIMSANKLDVLADILYAPSPPNQYFIGVGNQVNFAAWEARLTSLNTADNDLDDIVTLASSGGFFNTR